MEFLTGIFGFSKVQGELLDLVVLGGDLLIFLLNRLFEEAVFLLNRLFEEAVFLLNRLFEKVVLLLNRLF